MKYDWKDVWKNVWKDFNGAEIWKTSTKYLYCQRSEKKYAYFDTLQEALNYANGVEQPSLLKHCERIRNEA